MNLSHILKILTILIIYYHYQTIINTLCNYKRDILTVDLFFSLIILTNDGKYFLISRTQEWTNWFLYGKSGI